MATGAMIYKAELQIADMDRHYYQNHSLTIACHPSETNERMMVRVLAFALYAHEFLAFRAQFGVRSYIPTCWNVRPDTVSPK